MRFVQRHEDEIQLLTALAVAVLVGWRLQAAGWALWRWLPVAFFAFVGVALIWVLSWFLRRKLTYQRVAAANKADLRAGGDGWPRKR